MPTPLAAVIDGGTYRYVSTLVDILFDGSSSFDPDDPTSALTYQWGCTSKLADSDESYGYTNKSGVTIFIYISGCYYCRFIKKSA